MASTAVSFSFSFGRFFQIVSIVGIGAALVEQHRDHRELAVGALVHQVGDHGVRLAVDLLFARLVEVELHELVARPADVDRAARRVVHLDRVAVVDHLERRGLVVELDRRQVRRLGAADVDGRLDLAELAGGERLIELAPLRGPAMLAVGPVLATSACG